MLINLEKLKIDNNMKNRKKGLFVILSSPSGAGKTTLVKQITNNNKTIELSISYTTRKKRNVEKNNKDYVFISENKFHELKIKNYFIEWAMVFDNYYGTSLEKIKASSALFNSTKILDKLIENTISPGVRRMALLKACSALIQSLQSIKTAAKLPWAAAKLGFRLTAFRQSVSAASNFPTRLYSSPRLAKAVPNSPPISIARE